MEFISNKNKWDNLSIIKKTMNEKIEESMLGSKLFTFIVKYIVYFWEFFFLFKWVTWFTIKPLLPNWVRKLKLIPTWL